MSDERPGRASRADQSLWGKSKGLDGNLPPYPLVRHLLDAAAMALFLWDRYLSANQRAQIAVGLGVPREGDRARQLVGLCAGLHDIGKVSGFQFCDARAKGLLSARLLGDRARVDEKVGHDVAGMQAAAGEVLAALGFDEQGMSPEAALVRVAEIVGGHHGRFYRFDPSRARAAVRNGTMGGRSWAEQRVAHAFTVFEALGSPKPPETVEASSAVLITGVVILADWLVSQEGYLRGRQRRLGSLDRHFARSERDAERLAGQAGLLPVELDRKDFSEAYDIKGTPNPLQRSIAEELPTAIAAARAGVEPLPGAAKAGILLVTAAPGDGKSEAALEAERVMSDVFGTRGFAFLLPTMATSDQMHGRIAGILDRQRGYGAGLTLTHSMAWLSGAYADEDLDGGETVLVGEELQGEDRTAWYQARMRPRWWLRGSKRPLLAQYAVGTIDQALMAVLPVRHNALRMLALSGKTLIVDEAHAYDTYMQVLLGRLLNWLGAYGVPVVLLSATLPASVSDKLIEEYLQGAGHVTTGGRSFKAPYPGWLYVDAATGDSTEMSHERQAEQADERPMELHVDVRAVTHGEGAGAGPRDRLTVIGELLRPLAADGGSALVICNTVAQAQATYRWLQNTFDGLSPEELHLLHARFPGDAREARTRTVVGGMGRTGPRPERRVIVATQVVEQSLDLDADLVITDLAPMALLLQRAGRCWRHEAHWARHGRPGGRERPRWAVATGPRLVVLDPLLDEGAVPREWGEIYDEFLLAETSRLLAEREAATVGVPGDVQELVETVHGDRDGTYAWELPESWAAYVGKAAAERSVGGSLVIPRARSVAGLHALHHLQGKEDEWEAATRLGADSVRLLCVYEQENGSITLDADGKRELPAPGADGKMAIADVRTVMGKTLPVNATWFQGAYEQHRPPPMWAEHPMLSDLLLLTHLVRKGRPQPVTVGKKQLWLDEELGLVRE